MKIGADRSRRAVAFSIGIAVVACSAGIAFALWGPSASARAAGALSVVAGLFLLTSRNIFIAADGGPADLRNPELHLARTRLRIAGATVILMGIAQLVPDTAVRTSLFVCAAAVSMLGVFKVPRRLFTVGE